MYIKYDIYIVSYTSSKYYIIIIESERVRGEKGDEGDEGDEGSNRATSSPASSPRIEGRERGMQDGRQAGREGKRQAGPQSEGDGQYEHLSQQSSD